jgi:Nucleotidyl transferase AbiEii toxin, Type IV TA system
VIVSYPDPDEIEAHARRLELDPSDVVRDVARLAAIEQLCTRGFLNEDCVLVGGMALRLRGSGRFTVFDTDTSLRRPPLDELGLSEQLTILTDDLEVRPADGPYWERRAKLTIAQPINYSAYFASATSEPVTDEFSFTVNERGLNLPAEWLALTSPYDGLVFSVDPLVPVMQLTEQTAEKIVAWAAASLAKHYLDLGWIAKSFSAELDPAPLQEQSLAKLESGRVTHPTAYTHLTDLESLRRPLLNPVGYFGPLNQAQNLRGEGIKFSADRMTLDEAKAEIASKLVPLLFGD